MKIAQDGQTLMVTVAEVRLDEVLDMVSAWEVLSRVMNKQELPLLPGRLIPSINYYHHIEIILY